MKAHVWVMPKRTVLDPRDQLFQHALPASVLRGARTSAREILRLESRGLEPQMKRRKQLEPHFKEVLTTRHRRIPFRDRRVNASHP